MTESKAKRSHYRQARRRSRPIWIGTTRIGGEGIVAIEARIPDGTGGLDCPVPNAKSEIGLARKLEAAGADLICRSCHNFDSVRTIAEIAPTISLPLIADIGQCDPALAAAAAEAGARAVWFNLQPTDDDTLLAEMIAVGREYSCALGLVIDDHARTDGLETINVEQAVARYAVVQAERVKALGNPDFMVALRIRNPALMAATVRAISQVGDFPLALSVGPSHAGQRRAPEASSVMTMGLPLLMGVGDLVCISAGTDPVVDVHVAVSALRSLGLRRRGVSVAADPAFLGMRPDAADIATMLEERVSHFGQAIDVRLVGPETGADTTLTAQLIDPPVPAQGADAGYSMRIVGPVERGKPRIEVVDELAALVEESAATIDARDLDGLVADLCRRSKPVPGTEPETAMLWSRLAVAIRHAFRSRTTRVVWENPEGAAIYSRLTGKREAWQLPLPVGKSRASGPNGTAAAISIALGIEQADRTAGIASDVIAVVEKAAFEAGAAYESMRAAGASSSGILIVLIDPAGGDQGISAALGSQMSRMVSSRPYLALREIGSRIARQLPGQGYTLIKRLEEFGRGLAIGGTLFEELGLFYVGPVAGGSLGHMLPILRNLRRTKSNSPTLIHVVGADRAASRQTRPVGRDLLPADALSRWLGDTARKDTKIVLVVAGDTLGADATLTALSRKLPGRIHTVGNAARHGFGLVWGFAAGGLHPFMALDRRAFWRSAGEHAREIARLRLPICFLVDLAHDYAPEPWLDAPPLNLEAVPGFIVMSPSDDSELARMLDFARSIANQPVMIGFQGRAMAPLTAASDGPELEAGRGRVLARGKDIAILAAGRGVATARLAFDSLAEKGVSATLADARFTQPLDSELVGSLFAGHSGLIVLDDPTMAAGMASRVVDMLSKSGRLDFRHRLRVVGAGRSGVRDIVAAALELLGRVPGR